MKAVQVFFVLLIGLASSFAAHAGIRGVLGGGGLPEMLTLTAVSQISKVLRGYQVLNSELTSDEKALIDSLLQVDPADFPKIEFHPQMETESGLQFSDPKENKVVVPGHYIADIHGVPLPLGHLWSRAFEILAQAPRIRNLLPISRSQNYELSWKSLAQRIKAEFEQRVWIETVHLEDSEAELHLLQFKLQDGDRAEHRVFVEFPMASVDLTEALLTTMSRACGGPDQAVIQSLQPQRAILLSVSILSTWSCQEKTFEGQLWVSLKALKAIAPSGDLKSVVWMNSVREITNLQSGSCERILK